MELAAQHPALLVAHLAEPLGGPLEAPVGLLELQGDRDDVAEVAGHAQRARVQALGTPLGAFYGPQPYTAWQQIFDPLLAFGARNYWKSHNFTELSDGALAAICATADDLPSNQTEIFVGQLGGAAGRVAPDATAFPHRDARFVMNVHTRWTDPRDDARCIAWAREFYAATTPYATGGVYSNFVPEGDDVVRAVYGINYDRLAALKARYDPTNLFRNNQNIRPALH